MKVSCFTPLSNWIFKIKLSSMEHKELVTHFVLYTSPLRMPHNLSQNVHQVTQMGAKKTHPLILNFRQTEPNPGTGVQVTGA